MCGLEDVAIEDVIVGFNKLGLEFLLRSISKEDGIPLGWERTRESLKHFLDGSFSTGFISEFISLNKDETLGS